MISQQMSAATKAHNEAISREALQAASADATPDQGPAPLVGTGEMVLLRRSAAEALIEQWRLAAWKARKGGNRRVALRLDKCRRELQRLLESATVRQPQENTQAQT